LFLVAAYHGAKPKNVRFSKQRCKNIQFLPKAYSSEKKYQGKQKEPLKVEESKLPYGVKNNSETPSLQSSRKARIMENTVSVDEFFDDLISLVRSDYANI